jgi:hypothetical protein
MLNFAPKMLNFAPEETLKSSSSASALTRAEPDEDLTPPLFPFAAISAIFAA